MPQIYGCDKVGYVDADNGNRECNEVCPWKMSNGKCGYLKDRTTANIQENLSVDNF
jgi:hypothetical protein